MSLVAVFYVVNLSVELTYDLSDRLIMYLISYLFVAYWCFEPKESSLLCRTVWDMGRWSDSTLSLQHSLLYIYFYIGLACSYCKYF